MNEIEAHVIAKDNDRVVAYLLAMTAHSRFDIPILLPMFEMFEQVEYQNKEIADQRYMVVGQVCVAEGTGAEEYSMPVTRPTGDCFKEKYEFAITEIALRNQRSINAHKG